MHGSVVDVLSLTWVHISVLALFMLLVLALRAPITTYFATSFLIFGKKIRYDIS